MQTNTPKQFHATCYSISAPSRRLGDAAAKHAPELSEYNAHVPVNRPYSTSVMTPQKSPFKSHGGAARLLNALRYSFQGFGAALKHEAAFRQELLLCAILIPVAIWAGNTLAEQLMLIGSLFFVLVVELLNSAIEALADAITVEPHPLIGRAKDLGSAAVMLSIVVAAIVWIAVLAGLGPAS